jgi:hypothetical protein
MDMNSHGMEGFLRMGGARVLLVVLVALGCCSCVHRATGKHSTAKQVCTDGSYGELVLSTQNRTNSFIGAELISMTRDSATIKVSKTGQVLSAKTNGYFRCQEYGTHGLQLRWVAPEKGQIGVERFFGY